MNSLQALQGKRFDLVIVGGGIVGCGIARDAALRGMSVLLVEKEDIASGTSSASSKLAHGGLRYLEQMRMGLVRESLRERDVLLRTAPHLVRPLPFLLPLYDRGGRNPLMVRAGLTLYDLLAAGGSLPRHRMLGAASLVEREPQLRHEGLRGGALYWDAQMNDARLALENAIDAWAHNAVILTRTLVSELIVREARVGGVVVTDRTDGSRATIEAGLVINAAGPWYGEVGELQSLAEPRRPRLSRGSHIVLPPLTKGHALLLNAEIDGRVFFVIPWKGLSLIGTTEIAHEGTADNAEPTEDEIEYLLKGARIFLQSNEIHRENVLSSFAGVRPLLPGDETDLGEVSRAAEIREEAPGLLGVLGGKYTTYRSMAERTVDLAQRLLERSHPPRCSTQRRPLPGGNIPDMNDYFAIGEDLLVDRTGLEIDVLRYLLGTYGTRHTQVLEVITEDPRYREKLEPTLPFVRGEVIHAVRHEFARTIEDVVWRRTYRGYLGLMGQEERERWNEAVEEGLNSLATV